MEVDLRSRIILAALEEQIKCMKSLQMLAPGYFSSHIRSGTSELFQDNSPNSGKVQPVCYQTGETDFVLCHIIPETNLCLLNQEGLVLLLTCVSTLRV